MLNVLNWIIANYGTISLVLVTLFGAIFKIRRYVKDAIRTVVLSNRFHTVFGDTPAENIKKVHDAIQSSNNILEVRQQVCCLYLKIGVFICSLDGRCTWTNDYMNELFGLDSKDMKGFGWLSAVEQSDRKRVHEAWLYSVEEGIAYDCDYTICNHRDNSIIPLRATAVCVLNNKDEKECYVGYVIINNHLENTNEKKKTQKKSSQDSN